MRDPFRTLEASRENWLNPREDDDLYTDDDYLEEVVEALGEHGAVTDMRIALETAEKNRARFGVGHYSEVTELVECFRKAEGLMGSLLS